MSDAEQDAKSGFLLQRGSAFGGAVVAAALVASAISAALVAQPSSSQDRTTPDRVSDALAPGRRIAVTFDDLPGTALTPDQRCDRDELLEVSRRILAPFRRASRPVTGFVTESRLCDELAASDLEAVLRLWLDSGAELGNHTFSHLDLNNVEVEEYVDDIRQGERTLAPLLRAAGRPLRYFRHPYLHAGATPEKRAAVRRWLAAHGYQIGVVTMDNQEWVYSAVYARARARHDLAVMAEVVDGYLEHLEASVVYYERLARERFGRAIPHVLLLHANALNADAIERVVEMLRGRGYVFESLERVLEDEVYALEDRYVGPRGLSWLHRWHDDPEAVSAEPRESERVRELMQSYGRDGER